MKLKTIRLGVFCLALLFAGTGPLTSRLHAQSTTQGAIAATVQDATGALVPGASITLRNEGTNAEFSFTTDSAGYFKAPLLEPGTYTVRIKAAGFKEFVASHVVVQVGKVNDLPVSLLTGSASETVEVTGAPPVLNTESPDFASNLSLKDIDSLPVNGRRWSDLALLTPGVTSDANGFGLLSVRGISVLLNNVEIDGADDNQAFFSEERGRTREGYSTSQAAVSEFQVNTGVYSAEYGRAAGGVINSITKSGTNQLHGEAFFYDRDNGWGAMNPFTTNTTYNSGSGKYVTSPYKPKDWRKQWGFAAGGPLKTDKIFWFYAYEQYKRNFPGTAKANNPGTFFVAPDAALPTGASCPLTGSTAGTYKAGGSSDSAANVGACLMAARLGTNYAAGAAAYNGGLQDLLTDLGPVRRTGDEVLNTPKLDWQITDKHKLSVLGHRLRWDSPGGVQTQATNNYAVDSFGTDYVKLDYGVVRLDSFFTPSTSNEVRFQYGRELNWEGRQPNSTYTNNHLVNSTGVPPQVSLYTSTGFYLGMPYYSFRTSYPDEKKWQVADTATWNHNRHNLKFGVDVVHNDDLMDNLYESNGYYTYSFGSTYQSLANFFSDLTKPSGTCSSSAGSGVGTFPCYTSLIQGFGTPKFELATVDYGFFAQDDWKLNPRLTLNLGVRYDYEQLPAPYNTLINPNFAGTANQPSDKNNISPRVGFAYNLAGNGKTVVRGGYGIFVGRIFNAMLLNTYDATGTSTSQYTSQFKPSATSPKFPGVASSGAISATPSIYYFDKKMQNPDVQEFDLQFQQEFPHQNAFALTYLGALARHLPNYLNYNLDPSKKQNVTITIADSTGNGALANGATFTVPTYTSYINSKFQGTTEVLSNVNANYNAMVAEFQNRASQFVRYDVTYTWAHALDFAQNQSTAPNAEGWLDPYANARANYANSDLNVQNRVVSWAQISLPTFVKTHNLVSNLANGWEINPIYQYQNGLPYSAQVSGYNSGGAIQSGWTGTGYGTFIPAIGRNTYRRPDTHVVDLRLQKNIAIHERFRLELMGEVFNLANHVNVTQVNNTAYSLSYPSKSTGIGTATYQSTFGTPTAANSNYAYSPRQVQLALRLKF